MIHENTKSRTEGMGFFFVFLSILTQIVRLSSWTAQHEQSRVASLDYAARVSSLLAPSAIAQLCTEERKGMLVEIRSRYSLHSSFLTPCQAFILLPLSISFTSFPLSHFPLSSLLTDRTATLMARSQKRHDGQSTQRT